MVGRPAWWDIEMRERRLETISKHMNKKYQNEMEKGNYSLALSYIDRMLKIEHIIQPYIEQITGVKKLLKEHLPN
ncbi:MAG: hypothetical protein PVJ16_08500 [Nitrosopumilaceae archaeon]|jgi:hypothetical protein